MLSIIVVNWNVRDLLEQCLDSIPLSMGGEAGDYEILVVDNASIDGSVEMVKRRFPEIHLIANEENLGFGLANNQAYDLVNGSDILLLNPDTICPPGALAKLWEHFKTHPDINVMGSRLLNLDGTLQRWTGGSFLTVYSAFCHYFFIDKLLLPRWRSPSLYLESDVESDVSVDWVSGACMMLRKEDFPEFLFDPAFFMYGEDMELCHRVKQAGGKVVYSPVSSVVHIQGASISQQKDEVMQNSLKGPRAFYLMRGSPVGARFIDVITITGFAIRGVLYQLLAWVSPGEKKSDYLARSTAAWGYCKLACRVAAAVDKKLQPS
ncbi:MAG: glycosyltransferase family 2 protein [Immundisolibacteraceae bacterium]|nr:glycosyltransferase family 2 protein [Immundisolibacteraceae bacterium]